MVEYFSNLVNDLSVTVSRIISKKSKRVFLDYASITPVRQEVISVMNKYDRENYANPSGLYKEARKAKEFLDNARAEVGLFLNCSKDRVVFTSGGTEGNNIAILGVFEKAKQNGIDKPHIISVLTEHSSVREVLNEIEYRGGEITLLKPNSNGFITPEEIIREIKENTVLISVMFVNNEIGVVQPIKEIAQNIKKWKDQNNNKYPYFHTDSCQAPLFCSLDTATLGVDLLTLDGIKIGGPRSSGVLYIKTGVEIKPLFFGGGQEFGFRSGTEDVGRSLGLAKALTLARKEKKELSKKMKYLQEYFLENIKELSKKILGAECLLNGSIKNRVPNNINICFPNIDAEYLVVTLDVMGVSCSYSSSCQTLKEDSSSYVIESIRDDKDCSLSSIRFTFGRETNKKDLDFSLKVLGKALRQVSK